MTELEFDKAIAFIDLETTGLSTSTDRIVELTILRIEPDGSQEIKSKRINPEIPIPTEAFAIHGISNNDVADKPKFRDYARSLLEFLDDCDIGGFGITRFDLPILEAEFKRAGLEFTHRGRRILDAQVIYHKLEPRDLSAAYKHYCGKELVGAHTSEGDVKAALEVLESQLARHPKLPKSAQGIHEFCNPTDPNWIDSEGRFSWSEGVAVLNFGKYKGKALKEVVSIDSDYVRWIAKKDFSSELTTIVQNALNGILPERPEDISSPPGN